MVKKYFLPALLSVTFVILLMSLSPTIPIQNQPQPTLTAVVPTQAVETQWKIYRNEKYGFEFQYPDDWVIDEETLRAINSENDFGLYLKPKELLTNRDIVLTVQVLKGNQAKYLFKDTSLLQTKLFGNNKFFTDEFEALGGMVESVYMIGDEKLIARLTFGVGNRGDPLPLPKTESFQKELIEVEKILSTFKFLDISSTSKTYTNMKYGFEFQYPSSLTVSTGSRQDSIIVKLNDNTVFSLDMGESRVHLLNYEKNNNDKYVKNFSSLNIGTKSYPVTNDYFAEGMFSGYGDCINENFNINYFVDIESKVLAMTSQSQELSCNRNGAKVNVKPFSNTNINLTKKILSTFKFTK